MKAKSILALLLGIVFFSSIVFTAVQEAEAQPQEKMRRVTRENIVTLMLIRMTRFLELSEDQTAKIYPFFTRIEKEKLAVNRQIGKEMRELRMALSAEDPDEGVLKSKMQAIKELREDLKSKDRELESHLEENLTVIQQAKYLIFVTVFFKELRDQVDRARRMRESVAPKKK